MKSRCVLGVVLASVGMTLAPAAADAAKVKVCKSTGVDDLKAKNVRCDTASCIYKRSLRAAQEQERTVTTFRYVGLRWRCRAYNTSVYTWRCTASGNRLVQYRWLAGE
jgi:hypothetical protein